jgi:hypothetical protein
MHDIMCDWRISVAYSLPDNFKKEVLKKKEIKKGTRKVERLTDPETLGVELFRTISALQLDQSRHF